MMSKRFAKNRIRNAIFGCLFGMISVFTALVGPGVAYAESETGVTAERIEVDKGETTEGGEAETRGSESARTETTDKIETDTEADESTDVEVVATGEVVAGETESGGKSCKDSLGALGWLVCPATGKISEAVDFLYDKIEDILEINPIEMKDGQPIYEVWKYLKGVTNVLFIIFLMVMVYSQLTGLGITNYGLKKALPKLIVGAVLVNLSFVICSLAVDVSNIVGESLRGVFETIEMNTLATTEVTGAAHVSLSEMYSALAGGTSLAIGAGVIAFETGAIWMLIPAVLSAIAAVVIGLITIALRQAVVVILIMISPLALVAYILPNTEKWFRQWKDLLFKMLVFYPMFSLLFGASSLAGWAIIVSAQNGFWVIVGVVVQIFPLVASWSLMKMSGTFLSNINAKLSALAARPMTANRAWADSRRELTRQKYLASNNVYTPSHRLMQYLSDRRIAREDETAEHGETAKLRGQAYAAQTNYLKNGLPSKSGEVAFEEQARRFDYNRAIQRHKNNMSKGLGGLEVVKQSGDVMLKGRLAALDKSNIDGADMLKVEMARGEKIDYDNAKGFHKRMEEAINVKFDKDHEGEPDYKRHDDIEDREVAMERYKTASGIMEGLALDTHYAAAYAAHNYDTQNKIFQTKMNKYLELTPPTRDVEHRLSQLTRHPDAIKHIDSIIAGMRILNTRGDTDLVTEQLLNVLDHGVDVGTHASQAIASFLMFDVGDNDPFLKRFGKYINLETANAYNRNKRKNTRVTLEEYVTGEHTDIDENGEEYTMYAKRPMKVLLEGTSLDGIERTAMKNLDDILKHTYTKDGDLDIRKYLAKRNEIETAIGPQFISASLKYLSGSEQLKSAVSFLTGYNLEQKKGPDGKVMTDKNGDVIYDLTPRWGKGGDLEKDAEYAEAYFRKKTEQYFKDQTTTQVYGLRSDYRDPIMYHLLEALFEEYPEERTAYERRVSEIQASYGDLPVDEAAEKRKADVKALQMETAGKRFRGLMDRYGKLEQIYRTRRGGAALNSKDWLRDWLDFNNEPMILKYLDDKAQEAKARAEQSMSKLRSETEAGAGGDTALLSLYNQNDRVALQMQLGQIYEAEAGDDGFYEKSHDKLVELLGTNRLITRKYEDFKREVGSADKATYWSKLEELLSDSDNYDG